MTENIPTTPSSPTRLWRIEPVARPDDDNWLGRKQFARVIVRADSPAFARELAADLDTPDEASEFGQQDPRLGSAFRRSRLYRVVPEPGDDADRGDTPGIVEARPRDLTGQHTVG